MENHLEVPQKTKNRIMAQSSNGTSVYIVKGIEVIMTNRYLQGDVYCSMIHISYDMK
jgi:hypothetical protein